MPEEAPSFHQEEATVLAWLVARSDVAEAVDMALAGREEEALPALTQALRGVLGELGEEEPAAAAGAAEAAAGAQAPDPTTGEPKAAVGGEQPPAKRSRRASGLARCICVLVCGLRGCGKSALCNILREVLGGAWLNYDEFASKHTPRNERAVRQAFGAELRGTATKSLAVSDRDQYQRLVLIDRDSTFRAHRTETLLDLKRLHWRKRGGKVLLIEFAHSADSFGYGADGQLSKRHGEQHVTLCAKRIEERGAAHHTLWPSAKLRATLQKAAREAEAISAEELAHFDGRISVDVTLSPPDGALAVIEEIRGLGWLDQLRSKEELRPKVEVAWQAYHRAESQWREGAAAAAEPGPHEEWLTQCRQVLEAKKKAEELVKARADEQARRAEEEERGVPQPTPLFWKLDVPEVSKVLSQRGILPAALEPVEQPQVTLMHLTEGADGTAVSKDQLKAAREALEALQGEEFDVRMTEIVIEENVACALVSLPPLLPCASKVPHVTLGVKPGTSPRHANDILAEVKAGRKDGVTSIKLPAPRVLKGKLLLEYSPPPSAPGKE